MIDAGCYSSYLEVDLGAVRGNIAKVLGHLDGRCGIIPVVKADCYAMGMERISFLLNREFGVGMVGVAQVYEGLRLRQNGFDADILVMGAAGEAAIPDAVAQGLQLNLFCPRDARLMSQAAARAGKSAVVHIKLDTGMNRLGARPGPQLEQLLATIGQLDNIRVAGVFTHFATSYNYNDANTLAQYELFKQGVAQVRAAGFEPEYVHCCNSGATIWLEDALDFCTHVRPGSLYMGYDMMADLSNPLGVTEPSSWRAFVTNVHDVHPGEGVGYGKHFSPDKTTTVATVSIGYGDGLFRPMAQGGGPVFLGEAKTRYLATCMDQCFVDATGIPCQVGDQITVLGRTPGGQLLSVFELEAFTGQCYQNALCSINNRVVRVYKD